VKYGERYRGQRPAQALRPGQGARGPRPDRPRRRGARLPRPERIRQPR